MLYHPMYHMNTAWQQVVPKLNVKGRDLLQVSGCFITLMYQMNTAWQQVVPKLNVKGRD